MTINHKKNKSTTKRLKQQKMTRDQCKQNMTKQKTKCHTNNNDPQPQKSPINNKTTKTTKNDKRPM